MTALSSTASPDPTSRRTWARLVRRRARVIVAATAMVAAGGALAGTAPTAPAAAQDGKIVCGNVWERKVPIESTMTEAGYFEDHKVIARVFEVARTDPAACARARALSDHMHVEQVRPAWLELTDHWEQYSRAWDCAEFGRVMGGRLGADPCVLGNLAQLDNALQSRTASVHVAEFTVWVGLSGEGPPDAGSGSGSSDPGLSDGPPPA